MKKQTLLTIFLMTLALLVAACGTQAQTEAPPTTPEPAAPTETVTAPTEVPATAQETSPAQEPAPTSPEASSSATVSFSADVMPIFVDKCIQCHGVESKKEGLDMRTYDDLIKGSRKGAVLVPGNANESLFVQLIIAGEMPNRGEMVTPEELQILMDWVNQGALNN